MTLVRGMALAASVAVIAGMLVAGVVMARSVHASATLIDATGSPVGWVGLVEDGSGVVHVNLHVEGMTPGLHGVHIHAVGACSPTFAAAGGHYNPLGHQHGLDNPEGAHAGDLPNLSVNVAGVGHLDATSDRVTIAPGPATLVDADGSAFIVHANPDDQVTDAGNGGSGARIACGVIHAD